MTTLTFVRLSLANDTGLVLGPGKCRMRVLMGPSYSSGTWLVPARIFKGLETSYEVFVFWQRLRSYAFPPATVFLDKLCIAQHNEEPHGQFV